jgi:two-component system, response regulator RegA
VTTESRPVDPLAGELPSRSSSESFGDALLEPGGPGHRELRTAIYVYGKTTLTIECAGPCCLAAFLGRAPVAHLEPGSHAITVEPGVYLVRARAGAAIEVTGHDIDVVTIVDGKPARRTPRRLSRVMPSIERRALARFLRRPAPEPPPARVIRRVLAVDEDEAATSRYVRGFGPDRTVLATAEPATARALVNSTPFDLAIVELRVGGAAGLELGLELKRARPGLVVALCSGYLSIEIAVAAARAGIDLVLFKPVTAQELLRRIGGATDTPEPEPATLEHAEWEHISRVLADCNGNISRAAERLGIYRSSLQRRLRKSGAASAAHAPRARVAP